MSPLATAAIAAVAVALAVGRVTAAILHPPTRGARRPASSWIERCRSLGARGRAMTSAQLRREAPAGSDAAARFLDDMARRCATGETLTTAFDHAADTCSAPALATRLASVSVAVRGGSPLADSVSRLLARDSDGAVVAHVIGLCATHGGDISQSLDRAAATLRDRSAAMAERRVQAAQARLSAAVLTVLPLAFALWTLATSANVRRFELTPTGAACAAAGLLLNLTGWRLMRRIIGTGA